MADLLNKLYAEKLELQRQIDELNNRIKDIKISNLEDLIDLPVGTEFYLPPSTGFWSGKTIKVNHKIWIDPSSGVPFPFERGDYIVGKNIRLGKMPNYSMATLTYANW